MGLIERPVNLDKVVNHFKIKNYLETGVASGDSFRKISRFNLNMYGVEADDKFFPQYQQFPNATIFMGYSKDVLEKLLTYVSTDPTLYWLDAHYPGSDFHGVPYDAVKEKDIRVPLEIELNIITHNRDIKNDVFVIDDLRIYKDVPNAPFELQEKGGDQFIHDMLSNTHTIHEVYDHQGYAIAFPKDIEESTIKELIRL